MSTIPLLLEIACEDAQLDDRVGVKSWEECWKLIDSTFDRSGDVPLAVYITFADGDASNTRNPHPGWHWSDDGVRCFAFVMWRRPIFEALAGSAFTLEAYCVCVCRTEHDDLSSADR